MGGYITASQLAEAENIKTHGWLPVLLPRSTRMKRQPTGAAEAPRSRVALGGGVRAGTGALERHREFLGAAGPWHHGQLPPRQPGSSLDRYIGEFAGRHNQRSQDTMQQMQRVAGGMWGSGCGTRTLWAYKGMQDGALSLFAGAGGLDVGVARSGFKVACAVELDPHCAATLLEGYDYRKRVWQVDVRALPARGS